MKKYKVKQYEVKTARFDIDYSKFSKPVRVRFAWGDEFDEFVGKDCIQDFMNEIMQKKYRGYKIFPMENNTDCIDRLAKFLNKHNYEIEKGMNDDKCIFLKVYQHRYFNDEGKTTHSNVLTFMTVGF